MSLTNYERFISLIVVLPSVFNYCPYQELLMFYVMSAATKHSHYMLQLAFIAVPADR